METVWRILATLALVGSNGFFVAAEFAAVSARTTRLELLAKNSALAALSLRIKERLDLYLSSCQLGVTLASLGLGAVIEPAVAALVVPLLSVTGLPIGTLHAISITIGFAISTTLHIIIGEQAPKNWAIRHADRALLALTLPLVTFTYLFYPAIWMLNSVTNLVLHWSGVQTEEQTKADSAHTEAELKTLVAHAVDSGTIDRGHERILTSAFEFGDLRVRQIMTPRTDVVHLLLGQPLQEILRIVQNNAYTRLPLCDRDIDHVIGLVHMKDLFNHMRLVPGKLKFIDERDPTGELIAIPTGLPGSAVHVIGSGEINLMQVKRDILFVPELSPAHKLLRQFQKTQVHMAMVVDEFGATQGLVTLEDVIEEIVGDIGDEFDVKETSPDFQMDGQSIRINGIYPLHALRERIDLGELNVDGVDTIGGYIAQELGRIPKAGDTIRIGNYLAKVISVQQRRAKHVLLSPMEQASPEQVS